jgi:hypothetical protein
MAGLDVLLLSANYIEQVESLAVTFHPYDLVSAPKRSAVEMSESERCVIPECG